jgi:hypothetical protein
MFQPKYINSFYQCEIFLDFYYAMMTSFRSHSCNFCTKLTVYSVHVYHNSDVHCPFNVSHFQELFELAQRKFLRQVSTYADIFEHHPFPRLVILDFAEPEEVEEGKRKV